MSHTASRPSRSLPRAAGALASALGLALGAALGAGGAVVPDAAAAPAGPSAERLPVPYTFLNGAVAEISWPGAPLPGANDWTCRPSAAHPRPVVLVHGTVGGGTDNWATYGPLLHDEGYCVYTLTYGAHDELPWPVSAVGGMRRIDDVAVPQVSAFVDRVLDATGAPQVDLVGHSQGTLVSGAVAKWGRPGRVGSVVSLAALWRGTGGDPAAAALEANPQVRAAITGLPIESAEQMLPGSGFLTRLWEGGTPYAPGVRYTNVATRYDEAVWPFTSGLVPGEGVTNVVVQDGCEVNLAEHAALASDPRAADHVLTALDPATPRGLRCMPVAPVHGAVGPVPDAAPIG